MKEYDTTSIVTYTAVAACVFHIIHVWLGRIVSEKLFPYHFEKLSKDEKAYWIGSIPSCVNGVVVGLIAVFILVLGNLKSDPIWGKSWLTMLYACIGCGYFIADTVAIMRNPRVLGTKAIIVHHLIVVLGYYMILGYGVVGYFVAWRSLSELTQPFAFSRWALSACKKRDDEIYIYNGLCFTALFFLTRILILPYYYSAVFNVFGTADYLRTKTGQNSFTALYIKEIERVDEALRDTISFSRMNLFCKVYFILSTMMLDVLNVYWFAKIMKGCVKVLGEKYIKKLK